MNEERYGEPFPEDTAARPDEDSRAAGAATEPAPVTIGAGAAPPPPPAPARRNGLARPVWAVLALALIVTGVGAFFLGRWVGDDGTQGSPSSTVTATTTALLATAGDTLAPGDEPVADVAAALSPSVVQIETNAGLGSGVIYRGGYIITAAHVVADARQITVRLADGTQLEGRVTGADANSDVAVVQVDATDLPAAPMALGVPVETGQMAIAIGSPWGLEGSVTAGVVSTVRRTVTGQDGLPRTMIQTDTPINPGNSGGALADRQGRVIGINDAIFSTSGGSEGVGFAIPVDRAVSVADRLINGEDVIPAFLGVVGSESTSGEAGAVIDEVRPGSPAAQAGLEPGDVVVAIDGRRVDTYADLVAVILGSQPGDQVTLSVQRSGQELQITATLAERPAGS